MPPAVALCSNASPLSIPALVEPYPSACLLCLYPSIPLAVPVSGTSVHPFLLISVPLFFENILSLMTLLPANLRTDAQESPLALPCPSTQSKL